MILEVLVAFFGIKGMVFLSEGLFFGCGGGGGEGGGECGGACLPC